MTVSGRDQPLLERRPPAHALRPSAGDARRDQWDRRADSGCRELGDRTLRPLRTPRPDRRV